jgi:glycosyltransferase involved in cell wall biosynthesis
MKYKLNVVFFPHSANYGLAGTNRLQNIIYYLRQDQAVSVRNIALEDKSKLFSKEGGTPFVEDYTEIYYGPSISLFLSHIFKTIFHLHRYKQKNAKNLIYFYGEVDIKNFFFVLWAKLIGYKVIIDVVEDLDTITEFKSFKNKLKYKSAIFFRRKLDYFAHGFVVVSSHLEGKIRSWFPASPVFFLPVTINKELYTNYNHKRHIGPKAIFYSGSFNQKDGLPYLLEALAGLKQAGIDFRFVLSGKGTPGEMERFWDTAAKYELTNEIDYKGFLTRKEYINVLTTEADILCMTRINSPFANAGFPFKLGEFLATGKPVIASKVGDVSNYLSAEEAYLTEAGNAESIREALLRICNNEKAANQVGIRGKLAAMRYFDHEQYSKTLTPFLLGMF